MRTAPGQPAPGKGWRVYLEPAVCWMLLLGFSAGLPLLLIFGTLSFWLREGGIERGTIGFISWVSLAHPFKWVWAPALDAIALPWLTRRLGRRRAWLFAAQILTALALLGMAACDPAVALMPMVGFALLTGFGSATQDIALDAYRIESAPEQLQAAMAATYQVGYRLGMIWGGAGALWLADTAAGGAAGYHPAAWALSYRIMAASMLVGPIAVLASVEKRAGGPGAAPMAPERPVAGAPGGPGRARWLRLAAPQIKPTADLFRRHAGRAILLVLLISSFRLSDVVMGAMANPFYYDLGFSKLQVAQVSKVFGVVMTLVGGLASGAIVPRIGVVRTLLAAAVAAIAGNLLFALLAWHGADMRLLVAAISVDNFASGVGGAAFIAFLSGLTSERYTATQYALLSSLAVLLPRGLAGLSGVYVDRFGYPSFFCLTAALGLPAVALIARLAASPPTPAKPTGSSAPDGAAKR